MTQFLDKGAEGGNEVGPITFLQREREKKGTLNILKYSSRVGWRAVNILGMLVFRLGS